MKSNSMLALDFNYALLEYYKKLNINETELAVILVVKHLLDQGNTFITADLLSLRMSLPTKEIDKILVALMNKNIIKFDTTAKGLSTSIEPLEKKLYKEYQLSLTQEQNNRISLDKMSSIKNIYQVFEKELNRTLSPIEFSLIDEWVNNGVSEEMIIDALHEALAKNKKSLRSVDKIILQWQARDDIEKEGYTALNEKWNKNIEETLKIAHTKWVDDDND